MHTGELFATTLGASPAVAALRFAEAGVPVFPCVPNEKRPLTPQGFKNATADPVMVERWWRRWPDANIGLPTGAASGFDVVDVDIHTGGDGFRSLKLAEDARLLTGWAAKVRTPSGGLHLYFPASETAQRSWQAPGAHVDFRGAGGYIIAPPSKVLRPGGELSGYKLEAAREGAGPVDAAALRQLIASRRPTPAYPSSSSNGRRVDAGRLADWLARREEGERHGSLFWAACRLVEHGTDYADLLAALGPAASHIGLEETETTRTIRNAFKHASPNPELASSTGVERRGPLPAPAVRRVA